MIDNKTLKTNIMKVFLDGTTNGSKWREEVIEKIKIDYYNPETIEWTEDAFRQKLKEKGNADFCLYVITPLMTDFYTIVEVVDDSNKKPEKTVFCFLPVDNEKEFSKHQKKSLVAVGKMVANNGGKWFEDLEQVCEYLNSKAA